MPSGGWVIKRVHQGHYLPADASPKGSEAGLSRTHAGRGARHGAFPPGPWRGGPSAEGDNTVRFSQQEDPAYFLQFCILLFIKLTNSYIF